MDAPPADEAARIERALKTRPVAWREITRRAEIPEAPHVRTLQLRQAGPRSPGPRGRWAAAAR